MVTTGKGVELDLTRGMRDLGEEVGNSEFV